MKRRPFLRRYLMRALPPTVNGEGVHTALLVTLSAVLLVSVIDFIIQYAGKYWELADYVTLMERGQPLPGLMMPFWYFLLTPALLCGVAAAMGLGLAAALYGSFYQGGRSIYLMRRLPDGGRLLRRYVWTAPLGWAALFVIIFCLLALAFYPIWRLVTPAPLMPTLENIQRWCASLPTTYIG